MAKQNISLNLGKYQAKVDKALAEMEKDKIMHRLREHDYTLWKPDPTEISNRLGWLHIAVPMERRIEPIEEIVKIVRKDGYTHALLLGMGGSSLAPEVFRKTFGVKDGYLDLAVLDSTDPGAVLAHKKSPNLKRTLFIVSTKSGGTEETLSFFRFFYNELGNSGKHFVAITDPGSKLADIAKDCKFRYTFLNDSTIGGRYSALSHFGLVPAMMMGVDVKELLDRAIAMMCCKNAGAKLGTVMSELAMAGRDKLTLITSPPLAAFGAWAEQLIAESTGKEGKGILPVDGEIPINRDMYGDDRLFVYLRLKGDDTYDADVQALIKDQPVVRIDLEDLYDLGGEFFRWEMATAVAGHRMGINPFDQPNVESAKVLAREKVSEYKEKGALPVLTPMLQTGGNPPSPFSKGEQISVYGDITADSPAEALRVFLKQSKPRDYIAIHAYVQPTEETTAALQKFRIQLRDNWNLATTVGYGPRFLHSTGQLHKGDSGNGLFIQITSDNKRDVDIPDEAGSPSSSITFGVLEEAQALGDWQALLEAKPKRRVIRFHLGSDVIGGLERLMSD